MYQARLHWCYMSARKRPRRVHLQRCEGYDTIRTNADAVFIAAGRAKELWRLQFRMNGYCVAVLEVGGRRHRDQLADPAIGLTQQV